MPKGVYKRSENIKRNPHSEETKRKISVANKGKKHGNLGTHKGSTECQCLICGVKFWKNNFAIKECGEGKYCSRKCYGESKKGVTPKQLIPTYGKQSWNKGKQLPRGEKHFNWRGGRTNENKRIRGQIEHRLWRESVFARDNWTCQKCKKQDGQLLHPHHILNFSTYESLRFAIDNGITLHKECHTKFHKKFGYRNNTKEQLDKYLS